MTMEELLTISYEEAGIYGIDKSCIEKRNNAIQNIIEEGKIDKNAYHIIARWLIGERTNEIEECLEKVQKYFNDIDNTFRRTNDNEFQMLCLVLLYKHCEMTQDMNCAIRILCYHGIKRTRLNATINHKIKFLIDGYRIRLRKKTDTVQLINSKIQKKVRLYKGEDWNDEQKIENLIEQFEMLYQTILVQNNSIQFLVKKTNHLHDQVSCIREETDVLWWLMNGWSELYEKPFPKMNDEELAIAIPIELHARSAFPVLPYAARQIISKLIQSKDEEKCEKSLIEFMKHADKRVLEWVTIEEEWIEKVQPVLAALYCLKGCNCDQSSWKEKFKTLLGIDADTIYMTPMEFANHFQLELELYNLQ